MAIVKPDSSIFVSIDSERQLILIKSQSVPLGLLLEVLCTYVSKWCYNNSAQNGMIIPGIIFCQQHNKKGKRHLNGEGMTIKLKEICYGMRRKNTDFGV